MGQLLVCINKVLSELSQAHLFIYSLWWLSHSSSKIKQLQETIWLTTLTIWTFKKNPVEQLWVSRGGYRVTENKQMSYTQCHTAYLGSEALRPSVSHLDPFRGPNNSWETVSQRAGLNDDNLRAVWLFRWRQTNGHFLARSPNCALEGERHQHRNLLHIWLCASPLTSLGLSFLIC